MSSDYDCESQELALADPPAAVSNKAASKPVPDSTQSPTQGVPVFHVVLRLGIHSATFPFYTRSH